MRWIRQYSHWLAQNFAKNFKDQDFIIFSKNLTPESLAKEIEYILYQDFQKEKDLENEVQNMLNDLEQKNSFDRQKMYSMLKKKLAEKKGIIL